MTRGPSCRIAELEAKISGVFAHFTGEAITDPDTPLMTVIGSGDDLQNDIRVGCVAEQTAELEATSQWQDNRIAELEAENKRLREELRKQVLASSVLFDTDLQKARGTMSNDEQGPRLTIEQAMKCARSHELEGDIRMSLTHFHCVARRLADEVERLQGMIADAVKTADGVVLVALMPVWVQGHDGQPCEVSVWRIGKETGEVWMVKAKRYETLELTDLYSTRAALEAAIAEKGGE